MDKKKMLNRLKRVRGQVEGIIRMVEDDKYCINVSTQMMAVISAMKAANTEIISNHLKHCVSETLNSTDEKAIEEKLEEIEKLIIKLGK